MLTNIDEATLAFVLFAYWRAASPATAPYHGTPFAKRRAYIWITYCCPEPGRASETAKLVVDVERRQFDAHRCRASPRSALLSILQSEQSLVLRSCALEM